MAQDARASIDMLDVQFKLHRKIELFDINLELLRSNVNSLAVSSSRGLLFAGNPHAPELRVIIIKDLIGENEQEDIQPRTRLVQLPSAPKSIACSSDGNLLAVNFTQNASGVLNIYKVQAFTSAANISPTHSIRISPEDHVYAMQLLWNPVMPNNIAVVLNNGGLSMYGLKEDGNFEFHSLEKSHQVKCGCWSPKGKQIALGFPNGKIQQFKPDLTPAKATVCPPNIHSVPFDTIAIHWISTYQFAVIFLQHGEDCSPSLYIVNAPKVGSPSYINYYDVCYSGNGPRNHQFGFTHIQSWNLLLVTSANGVEVGLLGTNETSETPTWVQYTLLDEARIEMPLSASKDETFPMGFVYDTSSTHKLIIAEKELPTMPMIHVLGTDGILISFNFLNLKEGAASVCSPPPPIADTSGQFRPLVPFNVASDAPNTAEEVNASATPADMTFTFTPNTVTSTPALQKEKPVSLFGGFSTNQSIPSSTTSTFGSTFGVVATTATMNYGFAGSAISTNATSTTATGNVSAFSGLKVANTIGTSTGMVAPNATPFGGITTGRPTTFGGFGGVKPIESVSLGGNTAAAAPPNQQTLMGTQKSMQPPTVTTAITTTNVDLNKPLYNVPSTFVPPKTNESTGTSGGGGGDNTNEQREVSGAEVDKIVKEIMAVEINAFTNEIQQLKQQTNAIFKNIGNPNEIKSYAKRLNDLQEINDQAKDQDFELDLQSLRYSMNESYGMLAECRSKMEVYKNPDMEHLLVSNKFDPINRRHLRRLQGYVSANEAQLHIVQQQIDQQWEHYQDIIRRSSKHKMHMPCLEGIYQRMTKLQNVLSDKRLKLNSIKTKLRDRGIQQLDNTNQNQTKTKLDNTVESLAETILSINLSQAMNDSQSQLTANKVQNIRKMIQNQKIRFIKPQRPERVGLNSEVILETKRKSERLAAAAKSEIEKEKKKLASQISAVSGVPTKPAEFVPTPVTKPISNIPIFTTPAAPTNLNFGKSFQPTTANPPSTDSPISPTTPSTELPKPLFAGFGMATAPAAKTTPTASSTFSVPKAGGLQVSSVPTVTPTVPIFGNTNLTTTTNSNITSLFAGLGGNMTVTKVGPTSTSAEKEVKPFASVPQTSNVSIFSGVSKILDSAPKPFASSLFTSSAVTTTTSTGFGGSMTGNILSFGGGTVGNTVSFGSFVSPLGASITTTSTNASSAAPASALSAKSNFSFASIPPTTTTSVSNFVAPNASGKSVFEDVTKASTVAATITTTTTATTVSSASTATSAILNNISVTPTSSVSSITVTTSDSDVTTETSTTPVISETTISTSAATETLPKLTTEPIPPSSVNNPDTSVLTFGSTSVASPATTTVTSGIFTNTSDSVDKLFGNINICKPALKEETKVTTSNANGFVGFGAPTGTASGFLGFGSGTGLTPAAAGSSPTAASIAAPISTTPTSTITASSNATSVAPNVNTFSFASALSALSVTTTTTTTTTSSASIAATVLVTITTASIAGTSSTIAKPTSIFGGQSSNLFQASTTTSGTTSLFGAKGAATNGSIFANASQTTASNATTAPTSGNTFGNIPKPDQSVFGAVTAAAAAPPPPTGLFASAAAQNPSPFTSPTPAVGSGSIFGGAANPPAPATTSVFGSGGGGDGGSIFGGAPATNKAPFGTSSIFGGGITAKPSIFGAPLTNQVPPTSGPGQGSIFGQSVFGSTATGSGSIFGSAAPAALPQQQQQPSNPFGGTGTSIFGGGGIGGGTNTANAGSSIFGSSNTNPTPAFGSNAFSSFSSPSSGGVGSFGGGGSGAFAQGGASVAQTGFGSPQQQQSQQPTFGGAPAFGSPTPAFGASPTFGGAATFGGSKGFSSFGATASPSVTNPSSPSSFGGQSAQKNNLFETLGSSDTGISFGNLAQSGIPNPQKPTFGGSSFMNYRA